MRDLLDESYTSVPGSNLKTRMQLAMRFGGTTVQYEAACTDQEDFADLAFLFQLVIGTQHLQHVGFQQVVYHSAVPSSLHPSKIIVIII